MLLGGTWRHRAECGSTADSNLFIQHRRMASPLPQSAASQLCVRCIHGEPPAASKASELGGPSRIRRPPAPPQGS